MHPHRTLSAFHAALPPPSAHHLFTFTPLVCERASLLVLSFLYSFFVFFSIFSILFSRHDSAIVARFFVLASSLTSLCTIVERTREPAMETGRYGERLGEERRSPRTKSSSTKVSSRYPRFNPCRLNPRTPFANPFDEYTDSRRVTGKNEKTVRARGINYFETF